MTYFTPQLYISSGLTQIDFYTKGLGAKELRRWSNDDQTIHVAELSLEGAMFHLHEQSGEKGYFNPLEIHGTTVVIGIFSDDVDGLYGRAIAHGATSIHEPKDYEYGYRQAEFRDPFGHCWLIQRKI
jgi:PhnB protein